MTTDVSELVRRARVSRGAWAPELKGKTAIVTGAGRLRSIGRPVALELARQGVNVVLTGTGRPPERFPPDERQIGWRDVESVADEVRAAGAGALALVSDVRDPAAAAPACGPDPGGPCPPGAARPPLRVRVRRLTRPRICRCILGGSARAFPDEEGAGSLYLPLGRVSAAAPGCGRRGPAPSRADHRGRTVSEATGDH
jgi:hypothetical protein